MKKNFLIVLAAFIGLSAFGQFHDAKEPFMTKSFKEAFSSTEVETTGGNISVTGITTGDAKVEVYITSNNGKNNLSKDEIQKRLNEMYDLNVSVSNNKLIASAKSKERIRDWKKTLNISFKLFVPKATANDLSTSGGNISLENLSGNQEFATSGGSLHINNIGGKVRGRTSGGNIDLQD